jgi:hypothetical protein
MCSYSGMGPFGTHVNGSQRGRTYSRMRNSLLRLKNSYRADNSPVGFSLLIITVLYWLLLSVRQPICERLFECAVSNYVNGFASFLTLRLKLSRRSRSMWRVWGFVEAHSQCSDPAAVREVGTMVRKGENSTRALLRTLADTVRWQSVRVVTMVCFAFGEPLMFCLDASDH